MPESAPGQLTVRKAVLADIPAIASLVNSYAAQGIMLPRTEFELAEAIRDFSVAFSGKIFAGCGALHIYTPQSAEVRSLAVQPDGKGQGAGRTIVESLEREAREFGIGSLFAFTYVDEFFQKMGFRIVDRAELPLKAWKDCLKCPKFRACDEIAMVKSLGERAVLPASYSDVLPVLGYDISTNVLDPYPSVTK